MTGLRPVARFLISSTSLGSRLALRSTLAIFTWAAWSGAMSMVTARSAVRELLVAVRLDGLGRRIRLFHRQEDPLDVHVLLVQDLAGAAVEHQAPQDVGEQPHRVDAGGDLLEQEIFHSLDFRSFWRVTKQRTRHWGSREVIG